MRKQFRSNPSKGEAIKNGKLNFVYFFSLKNALMQTTFSGICHPLALLDFADR